MPLLRSNKRVTQRKKSILVESIAAHLFIVFHEKEFKLIFLHLFSNCYFSYFFLTGRWHCREIQELLYSLYMEPHII